MEELTVLWAALAEAEDVGPLRLGRLAAWHGGARDVVRAAAEGRLVPDERREELRMRPERAAAVVRAATTREALARARARVRSWQADGTVLLHPGSPDYPPLLAAIEAPPPLIFMRGRMPGAARDSCERARTVAVVGTRRASTWGRHFAERLAGDLAAAGVVVVSGLALGIDGAAHRGALATTGGLTLAVLGSGLDRVHPPVHEDLARRIARSGAVLSEHPPGTSARRGFFPRRNRIVSGLARALVVVEAPERSGTQITTNLALEQGRNVYCVPGRPDAPNGRGILALLRDGATPIGSAADLLDDLGWSATPHRERALPDDPLQRRLLATLRDTGGAGLDSLAPRPGEAGSVLAALVALEVEGWVLPDGNGGWRPS